MFCAALLAFVGARPSASLTQDEAIDLFKREMAEMQSTMKKMAERIEQLEAEREGTNGKNRTSRAIHEDRSECAFRFESSDWDGH
jgi:prefoldin subunit 5